MSKENENTAIAGLFTHRNMGNSSWPLLCLGFLFFVYNFFLGIFSCSMAFDAGAICVMWFFFSFHVCVCVCVNLCPCASCFRSPLCFFY